jgi:choline dehydrogenase-like flavoprotein
MEVVLTAGAIDSPRLLLLSGIGPKAHLQSLDIPVARDLPSVGQNLTDHAAVPISFHMKPNFSNRHTFATDSNQVTAATEQWLRDRTGPLVEHFGSIPIAFFKSEKSYQSEEFAELPKQTRELLQKLTVPSYELAMVS